MKLKVSDLIKANKTMRLLKYSTLLVNLVLFRSFSITSSIKAMSHKLSCTNPNMFQQSIDNVLKISQTNNMPMYVLFTGAKVESTGRSWCPDCVAAEPIIEQALDQLNNGYVLLECPVIRQEYKSPDYIYRNLSPVNLRCVPTFFKWDESGPKDRLNDSQSQNAALVKKFVEN